MWDQAADANPLGTVTQGNSTIHAFQEVDVGEKLIIMGNLEVEGHVEADEQFKMDSAIVSSDEFNVLDGVVIGSARSNKALVVSEDRNINNINFLSLSGIAGNLNINSGGELRLIDSLNLNVTVHP